MNPNISALCTWNSDLKLFGFCFRQRSTLLDSEGRCSPFRPRGNGFGLEEADFVQCLQTTFHHWQDQEKDGSHFKSHLPRSHLRNCLKYSKGKKKHLFCISLDQPYFIILYKAIVFPNCLSSQQQQQYRNSEKHFCLL